MFVEKKDFANIIRTLGRREPCGVCVH